MSSLYLLMFGDDRVMR